MTATVRVYKDTDGSAPTLTGQVGSLTTLLDAVLVNGYGSATAAGWTIGQTTTNKRQYINNATDGTGYGVWIDDTAASTAKEARATGFVSMSGLGTGSGQFPTNAQLAIGTTPAGAVVIRKSATADSTTRKWTIVADDTVFYLFTETGDDTSPIKCCTFAFGDFFSYKSSDANRCMIIGRNLENTANDSQDTLSLLLNTNTSTMSATIAGHFVAASQTGVGGSLAVGKHTDQMKMGGFSGSAGTGTSGTTAASNGLGVGSNPNQPNQFAYPNSSDGGLWVSKIWLHHNNSVRGYLKGLWGPLHHAPLGHGDTYSGAGDMAGKTFLCQSIMATSAVAQVHVETSNTWS